MPDDTPTSTSIPKAPVEPPTITSVSPAEPNEAATLVQQSPPAALFHSEALPSVPGYVVTHELAQGGMSVVFAARDPVLDRDVAVKVMLPGYDAARFIIESKVTAQLSHPNIPPVYAMGTLPDGRPFLAMKLIQGRTLAEELRGIELARPPKVFGSMVYSPDAVYAQSISRLLIIFEQICQTMSFAHSRGIIHRDLKPSNVMIGAFGEVQVMDWGLAKEVQCAEAVGRVEAITALNRRTVAETVAGQVKGTAAYMAPEQARGEPVDARTDVFALGGILAEILTGKPPFVGDTVLGTVLKAAQADLGDCYSELNNSVTDAELANLARKCLSADPADRFLTAKELSDAIGIYRVGIEKRLQQVNQDRAVGMAESRERSKRRKLQLALLSMILLLGAAAWWVVTTNNEHESANKRAAVIDILERGETALREGDADTASAALAELLPRLGDNETKDLDSRMARYRNDLAMLHALNAVESSRWMPWDLRSQSVNDSEWEKAFGDFGIHPERLYGFINSKGTSAAAAAQIIRESLIRERLLASLALWLSEEARIAGDPWNARHMKDRQKESAEKAQWLEEVLKAADPDDYRNSVRAALRNHQIGELQQLLKNPKILEQPPRFIIACTRELPVADELPLLQKTVFTAPRDLALLMRLGQISAAPAAKVRWYQAAVATHPRNLVARLNLGLALYESGDPRGATESFLEAIKLDPSSAGAHYGLGIALGKQQTPEEATTALKTAIGFDERFANAHYQLGVILWTQEKWDEALTAFRTAVKHDGRLRYEWIAEAHYSLGIALRSDARAKGVKYTDEIIACFKQAGRYDSTRTRAYFALGNFLIAEGKVGDAIDLYWEAIHRDRENADKYKIELFAALDRRNKNGDLALARTVFELKNPTSPDGYRVDIAWGKILERRGRIDEAIRVYQQAIEREKTRIMPPASLRILEQDLEQLKAAKVAPPPQEVKRP